LLVETGDVRLLFEKPEVLIDGGQIGVNIVVCLCEEVIGEGVTTTVLTITTVRRVVVAFRDNVGVTGEGDTITVVKIVVVMRAVVEF
jgi:hypothetical protein